VQVPPSPPDALRLAPLSEHRSPAGARTHPRAARFALVASRCIGAAPASPSIARHTEPLCVHAAPARSPLRCVSALNQARCARFTCRETLAAFAWNNRVLMCYSVLLAASKKPDLVTNLVNSNFRYEATRRTLRAEVASLVWVTVGGGFRAGGALDCVTGRRSNQLNYDPAVGTRSLTCGVQVAFPRTAHPTGASAGCQDQASAKSTRSVKRATSQPRRMTKVAVMVRSRGGVRPTAARK